MKPILYLALVLVLAVPGVRAETAAPPVFEVGRDGDYKNFREPVAVRTNSGKLVVGVQAGNRLAWPERSGQDLVVRISADEGQSWGPLIVAAERGNFSCQCHGLVYDAENDRLHFLYTTYNWDFTEVGKGRGSRYTAPIYERLTAEGKPLVTSYRVYSDDEGASWSRPQDITSQVGVQAHFGASEGRQLTVGDHAGRLLLPGSRMELDGRGTIVGKATGVWRSDDQGETWTLAEIAMPEGTESPRNSSSEARVTELPDGAILYNQRTRNTGRHLSWSKDGGETWTTTRSAPELRVTQCNGSLVTLRDKADHLTRTVLFSIPSAGGRSDGILYRSGDGGETWAKARDLARGNFAYSALVQLDPESVGLFYETGHYKVVRFERIPVGDSARSVLVEGG